MRHAPAKTEAKDGMLGMVDDIARQTLNSGREFGNAGSRWMTRNAPSNNRLQDLALISAGGAMLGGMIAVPQAMLMDNSNGVGNDLLQGLIGGALGGAVGWAAGLSGDDIRNFTGLGRNAVPPPVQGAPAAPNVAPNLPLVFRIL